MRGISRPAGHLVAAPDKFRGTADAAQAAGAAARGARRAGWTASEVPLADGGDGLLSAFGGERRHDEVTGPLGTPVTAEWKLVPPRPDMWARPRSSRWRKLRGFG